MEDDLVTAFQRERSDVITWGGREVRLGYRLPAMRRGSTLTIRWVVAKAKPVQGVQITSRSGDLEIAATRGRSMALWTDTAPESVTVLVQPAKGKASVDVSIRNMWRDNWGDACYSRGNSGMLIEDRDGCTLLRCSDGTGDVDFSDLVVSVSLAGQ